MAGNSARSILAKAGDPISTKTLASGGYLNPEQATRFLQQTFEATTLSPLVRHEIRRSKTGEIDKIGIGRRLLRRRPKALTTATEQSRTPERSSTAPLLSVFPGRSRRKLSARISRARTSRTSSPV